MKKLTYLAGIMLAATSLTFTACGGSDSSNSSYESSSIEEANAPHAQTESEAREIEADFVVLQQLQQRFENAYDRHDMEEAQRISDEALDHMHRMQQKNLTAEQRQLLQSMF